MSRRNVAVVAALVGVIAGLVVRDWAQVPSATAQPAAVYEPQNAQPGEVVRPMINRGSQAEEGGRFAATPAAVPYNPQEAINIAVYERTNRGVVNISTRAIRASSFFRETSIEGSGSGSVIDLQGHILTNYHVIEAAREISVTLFNGDTFPAELVGSDADNDIAVVRIEAPENLLHPINFGDSSSLRVGQHIIAIGNPFGLERTMSDGIISSLNRQITSKTQRIIKSIIQIDAALNQGNSGGPLLDSAGQLIGMNTAIATSTGDNAGIGFAIPVNTIGRVVPQLIANGRVVRPTIGITRVYETEEGLRIVAVTPGGPADKAGLRGFSMKRQRVRQGFFEFENVVPDLSTSDLIVGIDGQPVKSADDLLSAIETKDAGDKVVLRVIREDEPRDVTVVLGSEG